MLAAQRHAAISERVRRFGAVRVADLVAEFAVSDMTIRRDLEALADRGILSKVHGGATATDVGSAIEPGFDAKSVRQKPAKAAIARAAAELVSPGQAVALSGGTTTWALARLLTPVAELTVVTNSVAAAELFHRCGRPDQTVILTGGQRTPSDALTGPVATASLRAVNVDMLFLGVHGMNAAAGFTTPNLAEADTNRAMIDSARRLVVLADHTKWETTGLGSIAALADADVLVSDGALSSEARETLRAHVGRLIVAPEDAA